MNRISAFAVLTLLASTNAFAPSVSPFGVASSPASSTSLSMAVESIAGVKKAIKGMTKDNFDETLKELEPQLTSRGVSVYYKSMKRISRAAKELGTTVPEGYAKEAKCTLKRRTKQDEFIKMKEEARIAEEEEAAAAAAEATEAEPEAETPAEE